MTLSHLTGVGDNYDPLVQQLYVSYFGRPADTGGLANFKSLLASAGGPSDIQNMDAAYTNDATVRALIDSFGNSAESNALYGGDTIAFVTAIYTNLLNRAPDPDGLRFWTNAIDGGTLTKARTSFSIMAGALANTTPQGMADAALVRNKVTVASNFTHAIPDPAIYAGDAAAMTARAMLRNVTSSTDPNAFQATVVETVNALANRTRPSVSEPPAQPDFSATLADAPPAPGWNFPNVPLTFAVTGAGLGNVELVSANDSTIIYGRFTISDDRKTASLTFYPIVSPLYGSYNLRILAWDSPPGGGGRMIEVMAPRTYSIRWSPGCYATNPNCGIPAP